VAQRTHILYVDDIDGGEADGTIRFGLDGTDYEIDLSDENAERFAEAVSPYVAAARKVPAARRGGRGSRPARHNQSAVREWAKSQGMKVSDRGRIPSEVLAKYEGAH
jgi:hypothetical protein